MTERMVVRVQYIDTTTATIAATTSKARERFTGSALAKRPLAIEPDVSLSVREHISQASGQGINTEEAGDALMGGENDARVGTYRGDVNTTTPT